MDDLDRGIDDFFRQDPSAAVRRIADDVHRRLSSVTDGIMLYGAGHYGGIAASALRKCGIVPTAFIDSNPRKRGQTIADIPVIDLNYFLEHHADSALVVVTVYNCVDVLKSLAKRGIVAITYAQLALTLGEPLLPYCGIQHPAIIWNHETDVRRAMNLWADVPSRSEFLAQLNWSVTLDPHALSRPRPAQETYFDSELVVFGNNEIFVDCGAFDGDSVAAFVKRCPGYRSVLALEPDPGNRDRFCHRFGGVNAMRGKNIELLPFAAGDRRETVFFNVTGTAGSAVGAGSLQVDSAPLDELLSGGTPTLIKMDIEGAEPLALRGATRIMRGLHPRLAICLYHDRRHLWELPLLIQSAQPDYKMYLRRYADECWELVNYAFPVRAR
jgi:FkbM family methyltransferase